jgi:zona occludens toxin
MINGLEGIPGSGKSYEAVVHHVLPQLASGRKVITNLPLLVDVFAAIDPEYRSLIELRTRSSPILGVWNAAGVDDKGNGHAFALGPVSSVFGERSASDDDEDVGLFGGVWDYYTAWKHPLTGQGPVFIIDECHIALPVTGTQKHVVEWYKLHRHFNVDVLLCTQNFRDINQPIARLLGMMVKVRKADILGKKDCYIRKVHAGYRGAVISTEERKYKPHLFGLYKSHSQGNSVAESAAGDVSPFIVKFRRFTWAFIGVTVVFCAYAASRWRSPLTPSSPPGALLQSSAVSHPVRAVLASGVVSAPAVAAVLQPPDPLNPEPYQTKGLHITGRVVSAKRDVFAFAVSASGTRLGQVTSDDLRAAGYLWRPLTDCAGVLVWAGVGKSITCDAPAVSEGSTNAPVVITVPAGSQTPTARSDGLSTGTAFRPVASN